MTMSISESIFKMTEQIYNLQAENAKLNAIIDGYQPRLQALKDENFELKESLKCFQKPEVVKVLTDYRTGEIDNLRQENELLKSQIKDLQIRKDRYFLKGLEQERQISDYLTLLQEIKEIAERQMRCCTCNFQNDDYKSGCKTCESKYAREMAVEILQLITKAEEE